MSRSDKTVSAHQGPAASTERIEDVDVSTEMQGSFLEYAYSVIYSRALPDARDGLKPVQRRILYQMSEMGLRPDRGHVKSARVVGEVMGKLHPHGDTAIYDAMVRMAQAFTLRVPLIDGHGNFGSLDDGPAAPRYTEARLAAPALAMTEHLDEDVVDFVPNYDNQLTQPDVLPAAYPNLLVNGASGIAVGMATNMAPHNLVEVIGAARHLLAHPRATLDELMEFVPGPDLPTGGTIVGLAGIRDAYLTGRGSFKTRAKVSVEAITARKAGLVVSELPYLVGPERVIEKIKDGVNSKKLSGISDVTDLTDRTKGLRLVIGIKTGFSPEAVLEQLYRVTPLEDSFNINAVALVDGGPQTLGLVELLQVYVNHRVEVVTRRSAYRLARRRERLHLVEGLLIAILDIDEVIQVIRASDDTEQARTRLIDVFDLSQLQAEYILELRLRRLTRFSRIELETERDQLLAEIKELEALLASKQAIRTLVSDELATISDRFGTPRRTLLTEARPSIAGASARKTAVLEVSDSPTRVYLSSTGRIARVDLPQPGDDQIERITPAHRRSKHDAVLSALDTTSRSEIGAVTNRGRLIRFSPVDLPVLPPTSIQLAAGVRVRDYLSLGSGGEVVRALVSLDSERAIALGTRQGIVKRVTPNDWANKPDFEIIALKPGDEVVGAVQGAEDDELVFVASDAQLLRFPASTVRPQGRTAGGMAGIKLGPDARVVFFTSLAGDAAEDAVVATIASGSQTLPGTDPGSAKVSAFTEFPAKGRATGGVRSHRFLKGEDALAVAWVGAAPARALGVEGSPRTLPDTGARRDASGTMLDAVVGSIGSGIG
ncbi:DNA topoisomerase IV [Cryobacterium sp. LW097]|uniref:DNA gyrase/topoisomerase IV subunit A n=1 Tax=unclassified Cryobacterium TaxID=2649013 RepID=UPI000B4CAB3C|nr:MULTISPECIES: DNA topoisomerase IV subunit A [unclassified Cryobacterium]ASD22108.1 DNA topoisomerase IV [Cryobacterium sp. LW097]TFC55733.1 DNA topoisomerase IV subunit A [Cryobacterium sp. TMB3-1-2]TFC57081.1 DNA topoisomerase IV subunit A [Cryobacterium sp. TMB1-7]TFC72711.1 DNA topoisomerase IV subunit A [Cryobacterium sp. TMB3-15]TFC76217.1 DNA topoisomerase IV subunit A [Cryobacterium sp. TMB3-10]